MTPELSILALASLLQVVQYALMTIPANMELGPAKTLSPRDRARLGGSLEDQLSEKTARLYRALNNHFEGLILFSIAVFIISYSDQSNKYTVLCAAAYLLSRILYIPAYYFGWRPWRSLIWLVGFLATAAMLVMTLI